MITAPNRMALRAGTVLCLCTFVFTGRAAETPAAETAGASVLQRLETGLAQISTVQTEFVQEKELAVFTRKVVTSGTMAVQSPDRVAWHVRDPVRYSVVIRGSQIRQWDEDTDKVQTLRLDRSPAMRAAFEQLTAWLSGQYAELRRTYEVTVESRSPWVITFTPRDDSGMVGAVSSVTVTFREDERYIRELVIREGPDAITRIRFFETRLNQPVSEDMWKVPPVAG